MAKRRRRVDSWTKPLGVEYRTHRADCSEGVFTGGVFEVETFKLTGEAKEASQWLKIRRDFHPALVIENGWDCKFALRVVRTSRKKCDFLVQMWWEPVTELEKQEPLPRPIDEVFLEWVAEIEKNS